MRADRGPSILRTEELAHAVVPVLGARIVRAGILGVDRLELAQDLLLPRGKLHRRFDHDVTEEVAVDAAAHALDSLVAQPEDLPGLRFRRDLELGVTVERRDLDLAP